MKQKKKVYDLMDVRETGNDDTLICDICEDEDDDLHVQSTQQVKKSGRFEELQRNGAHNE